MGNTLNNKKANGLALLPFLVFIVVYMGAGLVYQSKGVDMAFYQFPSVTAMFLAVLVAFIMFKGSINEKFDTFAKGAANVDVLTMLIIYILAGAFATVAAEMGGRDATVNLGLSLVPVQFLAAGLFVIAAFMGTATGTSMGTISAITPIAVGVAEKGGLNMMVVLGAVIGGAMFGDNLSMISDTTIAATRSQHCEMRDKFRVNFLTALPAALVTIVVLLIVGRPETVTEIGDLSYSFIKVIPYLLVLILALVGMNVFLVLTIGIFAAGIVGIATGAIDLAGFAQAVYNGFCGMNEVFFLTLLCGGMSELIAKNGGIEWIIQKLGKVMKGNKSAQVGIAAMVSLCDCATANNTVAIIVAGDMAREVSHEYKVDPRRTASLLDMFSCVFQGIIPYGAQLLVASSLCNATVTNGTTISARRFAQALKNHGNEVRVIATGKPADYKYAVRQMRFFPVVEHLITSQGMRLAIPNRHVFEKAAAWADVVHFMMPSPLGIMGLKHVEKLGIPHTAAFHCQPENITFTLHMGNSRRVNDFVYNRFRDTFFNRFTHIHCPSNMIANQLRQHGYTARLHVISNGISPEYIYGKREKEPWMQGLFNVLMVGRYAGEKRQDELIDACAKSRHAREIQVILAGKGPLEKKYRRLAEKLPNPIVMEFYEPARLLEILHMADLYVHTSDAEIEAMSCMEAFACGLVPVIADSPRSATPQFALDERSLFPAGDTDALAQRIDWWIEHPEERQAMERRYAEHARQYSLEESIRQTEEMFRQAIAEQRGAKA